jgi:hypothetical protein
MEGAADEEPDYWMLVDSRRYACICPIGDSAGSERVYLQAEWPRLGVFGGDSDAHEYRDTFPESDADK